VHNFTGGVVIEAEGNPEDVTAFINDLSKEKPPIARIEEISTSPLPVTGNSQFVITASREASGGTILLSPDVATCEDCRRELLDPANRRYRYPFINCTNCGPRFTIIESVPYDRPNTTMQPFTMCPQCQAEYDDINDRRYQCKKLSSGWWLGRLLPSRVWAAFTWPAMRPTKRQFRSCAAAKAARRNRWR